MAAGAAPAQAPSNAPEDKVRKDLVQVFFGLVLGQIAVYVASLIEAWDPESLGYGAAWSHIILAFFLTTTSWFGWQMSVRKAALIEEASVFQVGFVLSILDIVLVTLYFLLVHQVEIEGVAAFPPKMKPTITDPSAKSETWIMIIVFAIYFVWDTIRLIFEEVKYGPWPSVTCLALSGFSLIPALFAAPRQPAAVIWTDVYLIGLVFLFRAFKRLQKWNFVNREGQTTLQIRSAPGDIQAWTYVWSAFSLFFYLLAIAPLARTYICG